MENQDTTSNEPKNDNYELLSKLVTSVDEYNENALSLSLDIEDLQNIYGEAQSTLQAVEIALTDSKEFSKKELEKRQSFLNAIPKSIGTHISLDTLNQIKKFEKKSNLVRNLFFGSIFTLILALLVVMGTVMMASKWYSESIRAKSEIREEILDEIKKDGKAIFEIKDYDQLKYNTDLMNKWMKKNPKDGEEFMKFKEGFESR